MFGAHPGEQILMELFIRHYDDVNGRALEAFLNRVKDVSLPFVLVDQMRRRDYLGYPGFESGLPTLFYYFVPASGWGSSLPLLPDPLNSGFVYRVDGFGANLGCPLRLKRALEILLALPVEEQTECLTNLACSNSHLPTVEEILWLDAWKPGAEICRSEGTKNRTHDWLLIWPDLTIRLECKMRAFNWAKIVDGPDFKPAGDFLGKKAVAQLPNPPEVGCFNVVAVTGAAAVDDEFRASCIHQLRKYLNIQAVIYRNMLGNTTVFSLSQEAARIAERLAPQPGDQYQPFYFFAFDRREKQRRAEARMAEVPTEADPLSTGLFEIQVESLLPALACPVPPLPYRSALKERLADGEPVFEIVPPYKPADESE